MCDWWNPSRGFLEVCKTQKQIWEIHLFSGGRPQSRPIFFLLWTETEDRGASASGLRNGGVGVWDGEGLGGLVKTRRKETESHRAAYLGRKTTAAACRRGSGSASSGPRWQSHSGSLRSTGKGGAWATRRPGACGGVGCSSGHSIRRNGAVAALGLAGRGAGRWS
jgi:hypothetical protein